MDINGIDLEEIKRLVKGKTLEVYLLLARNNKKEFGIREIQRELGFSSVSVAVYHATKLEELALVTKSPLGKYQVKELISIGSYDEFFVLKGRYLPQETFFVTFFTAILVIISILVVFQFWSAIIVISIISVIISAIKSWFRFYYLWKRKDEEDSNEREAK